MLFLLQSCRRTDMGSSTRRSKDYPHATTTKLDIVIVSCVPGCARRIEQHYVIVYIARLTFP